MPRIAEFCKRDARNRAEIGPRAALALLIYLGDRELDVGRPAQTGLGTLCRMMVEGIIVPERGIGSQLVLADLRPLSELKDDATAEPRLFGQSEKHRA